MDDDNFLERNYIQRERENSLILRYGKVVITCMIEFISCD